VKIERYKGSRYFALYDDAGKLVVVTVYKRGAQEVLRRLRASQREETATAVSSLVSERKVEYGDRG
jgi:hypothetical protein